MTLLAAQSLTVTARIGGAAVPVIRDLDFALAPGKILGIVGESGAGKSMVGSGIGRDGSRSGERRRKVDQFSSVVGR
jgi:peptide/nickel transport system ATP-binding protein